MAFLHSWAYTKLDYTSVCTYRFVNFSKFINKDYCRIMGLHFQILRPNRGHKYICTVISKKNENLS